MKTILGISFLLISLFGFSATDSDTTLIHFAKAALSEDGSNTLKLSAACDTIVTEEGLDAQIDGFFRPVADFVGSIIFYSINIGSLEEQYTLELSNDNLKGQAIDFSGIKVEDKKQPANVELIGKSNFLKEKDGKLYITQAGADLESVKVKLSAPAFTVPLVLIVLIGGAIFLTVYFKFANFRLIPMAIRIVSGKYDHIDQHGADPAEGDPTPGGDVFETIAVESADGEVTHFQALTAALSATVGLGNIAGVAVAISLGGPGATFWMILAGFLGMASKFVECTLGVKYREVSADGTVHGGPMYYLSKGLKERGLGMLGRIFAIFFAIMCVGGSFGGGNMFQANQAATQMIGKIGTDSGAAGIVIGIIMAVVVGVVIIGGIKRIGSVTEKVVPFMAAIYVLAALIILGANFSLIPEAFNLIFDGAFGPDAALGGIVGVLIVGFQRAAFSNEAGVGSAAIAHSAVKTKYPASEGVVALLEPFIDTVVICTMTALVLIITNIEGGFIDYGSGGVEGISLTATAFNSVIPYFDWVLMIAAVLFAISTMLSWSYYGLQAWKFLFGKGKIADTVYKLLFLFFVVVGASISLGAVIDFSDAMIFAMVFPNILGLIILAPKVGAELKRFRMAIAKN
jgi:AGCS family alanine or glycine:cation symporter